ncbi:hypothetical protein BC941DRAFT_467687 [Chlamydoabsidia padenii]|nr:hypothetical protein BC941DRAFT_467687 [Chlamydoabsidia padenii]
MQTSSMIKSSSKEMEAYTEQELYMAPPPYSGSDQESLPCYTESSSLSEIENILSQFPPRWDDQRVDNQSTTNKVGQLLDRMEAYRHKDQEWTCHNQTKLRQLTRNMYHTPSKPSNNHKRMPSLSSAKSKYQKITISIAKEREHLIHQMKKIRPSSTSSCTEEFDTFLNSVYVTSSQMRMSNQCATRLIPTA